jgi:hypothetical protein
MLDMALREKKAFELAESLCPETDINGQSRWEAFWRTQVGNTSLKNYPATTATGE